MGNHIGVDCGGQAIRVVSCLGLEPESLTGCNTGGVDNLSGDQDDNHDHEALLRRLSAPCFPTHQLTEIHRDAADSRHAATGSGGGGGSGGRHFWRAFTSPPVCYRPEPHTFIKSLSGSPPRFSWTDDDITASRFSSYGRRQLRKPPLRARRGARDLCRNSTSASPSRREVNARKITTWPPPYSISSPSSLVAAPSAASDPCDRSTASPWPTPPTPPASPSRDDSEWLSVRPAESCGESPSDEECASCRALKRRMERELR
eukprot:Selendium_serpulae@DN1069_c0_g1_i1.p1